MGEFCGRLLTFCLFISAMSMLIVEYNMAERKLNSHRMITAIKLVISGLSFKLYLSTWNAFCKSCITNSSRNDLLYLENELKFMEKREMGKEKCIACCEICSRVSPHQFLL